MGVIGSTWRLCEFQHCTGARLPVPVGPGGSVLAVDIAVGFTLGGASLAPPVGTLELHSRIPPCGLRSILEHRRLTLPRRETTRCRLTSTQETIFHE